MNKYTKLIFGALIFIIVVLIYFLVTIRNKTILPTNQNIKTETPEITQETDIKLNQQDLCENIEGIQTFIPTDMEADSNNKNNCISISKKEIVYKSLPAKEPTKTTSSQQAVPVEVINKKNVPVEVFDINTYNETRGQSQYPASVGYKFKNSSSKDITIEGIYFNVKTQGDAYLDGSTLFSVTEKNISKTPAFYLSNDNGSKNTHYEFPESIIIPANSSLVLYINVWNFAGDLRYYDRDKTIFTLIKVDSLMLDVEFNLGSDNGLVTEIPHKQP